MSARMHPRRVVLSLCVAAALLASLPSASRAAGIAPTVLTGTAGDVTAISATLNGTDNQNGSVGSYHFDYWTARSIHFQTTEVSLAASSTPQSFQAFLPDLQPATTYYFLIVANNAAGTSFGQVQSFTTGPELIVRPTVVSTAVTGISATAATINGTDNQNGSPGSYHFQWGASTDYVTKTPQVSLMASSLVQSFWVTLSGLTASTTYRFRIAANNAAGTSYGQTVIFTTSAPDRPTVLTGSATGLSSTGATLNGTDSQDGSAGSYHFDYGKSTSYGSKTGTASLSASSASQNLSAALPGLAPSTTYHFRIVANNAAGTSYGQDMTFTTPAS